MRAVAVSASLLSPVCFFAWMVAMPGAPHKGPRPAMTAAEVALEPRLRGHVEVLAGEIGPRNVVDLGGLRAAEAYIDGVWRGQGHEVLRQTFLAQHLEVSNLEIVLPGHRAPDEIVIIGAHYDTHIGSPGADDNGSGVAALLELGALLRRRAPGRTVRLVAFVNEEYPFARTDIMGSVVYARRSRALGEDIVEMISLEMLGNYSDLPGSQTHRWYFEPFYSDRGDFIGIMGDLSSRGRVARLVETFRGVSAFPCDGLAAPGWLAGTYRSDHWAFWLEGYPGVMITDTASFRTPDYHTASDTPDTLEYDQLARLTAALADVIEALAR